MEKRRFSRVPFRTLASLESTDGSQSLEGEVKNLSLAGMLLETDGSIEVNTDVRIEIFLMDGNPDMEIRVNGKIVRISDEGIAVQFNLKGINIDSLTHLRYVVSYNLGDGDTVMEEYFHHIDS
ncbi:MAG: PilZ domain-containing protein [Deltaproteobacteria bacterium]|nr:PilZ domain-containing protein [Deltaproteobacteria bacterium]MBN2672649.1 PilZ domain-containing protein [Deltaproteobacteria bacterium]